MFLRNCCYVAGWSHHIAADSLVSRTMLGEPIVLYRKADGGVVALEDRCCHRLAPLSRGRIEGDDLRCMYHGLKFAPSGKCVEVPGQDFAPSSAVVRSYPVVERDCWVWLWMGEPTLADPALIPAALGHDHPDWFMQTGQLAYEANYELINDNLLDLTHLSYVHEKTLGRNSMSWGESRPQVTPIERGLRIARWVVNNPAPAYLGLPPRGPHRYVGLLRLSGSRRLPACHAIARAGYRRGLRHGRAVVRADVALADFAGGDTDLRAADGLLLLRLPQSQLRDRGAVEAADRRLRKSVRRRQGDDRSPTACRRVDTRAPDDGPRYRWCPQPVPPTNGRADRGGADASFAARGTAICVRGAASTGDTPRRKETRPARWRAASVRRFSREIPSARRAYHHARKPIVIPAKAGIYPGDGHRPSLV